MTARTGVSPKLIIGALIGVTLLAGVFGPQGQQLLQSTQGKVVRAEVETEFGEFDVALHVVSTLTGSHDLVDNRTYSRSFGQDILVRDNEVLTVYLTAGAIVTDEGKRILTCRLRLNGKEVDKHPVAVPAGRPGPPCAVSMVFNG